MRLLFLVAVLNTCVLGTAHGDIIFDIDDVVVTPGQQAVVGVFVRATAGESLTTFNLPIDIGNNGFGLPPGLTFAGATAVSPIGGFNVTGTGALPGGFIQNYDGVFNDVGGASTALPIGSGPNSGRHLFNILVDTTVAFSGTQPLSITSGNLPGQFNVDSSLGLFSAPNGSTLQVIGGSITAVPEPGSLILLGLAGGISVWRRRRA